MARVDRLGSGASLIIYTNFKVCRFFFIPRHTVEYKLINSCRFCREESSALIKESVVAIAGGEFQSLERHWFTKAIGR